MSSPERYLSHAWVAVPVLAVVFLVWTKSAGVERVEYLSDLGAEVEEDFSSPTGYADGYRALIVPEHSNDSYQWIMQTQEMLANGDLRVTHAGYDNAPVGREVRTPSPYRWWLAIVAWTENQISGLPMGQSVERAALYADPAAQILFLIAIAALTAWQFGSFAAALVSVAWTFLFPLGGTFLPGAPDDHGLSQILIVLSLFPLIAGTARPHTPKGRRLWFLAAGAVAGAGVWVDTGTQLPVLLGTIIGGVATSLVIRSGGDETPDSSRGSPPWRAWALGGAVVCIAAYVIENAPGRMDAGALRLQVVHPIHAIVWLGAGELLARFSGWMSGEKPKWNPRSIAAVALAALAVISLPVAMSLAEGSALAVPDPFANRLTNLPAGVTADNLADWYLRQGATAMVWATILPLLLVLPAIWLIIRRDTSLKNRSSIAIALGPVAVAFIAGFLHLRWWNMVDSTLVVLLIAVVPALPHLVDPARMRWLSATFAAAFLIPGAFQLFPGSYSPRDGRLSDAEQISLLERNLSYWLAKRPAENEAIVVAPPNLTVSLCFHGGLRGLGSPFWENKDGFGASVRLVGASSADEGQALFGQREVTHVVIPSWDSFLEEYARLGTNDPANSLVGMLERWLPPRWLRPVPYHDPEIAGVPALGAVVFETVEVQDNVTALSRLAEYFVETQQLQLAARLGEVLKNSFQADLGALVARAQVAFALNDSREFREIVEAILPYLSGEMDENLLWDRRVSLTLMLAQGRQIDLARTQMDYCMEEMDEYLLRSLSPATLYRFRLLVNVFEMDMPTPDLDRLAVSLLPRQLRDRLEEIL